MPRFFIDPTDLHEGRFTFTGDDAHHIARALRMAAGDAVTLSDDRGLDYDATLVAFTDRTVTAEITASYPSKQESPLMIHLYQGYPKGDKLETVIGKAVELGVASVTPFLSSFCIKRPPAEKEEKLLLRYNRIAEEAAKQCGRGRLPTVHPTKALSDAVKEAVAYGPVLFCYEADGTRPLPAVLASLPKEVRHISVFVGSEGGFSEAEAQAAREAGCHLTGLGPRILRTETAPLFVLAALSYRYEL